jgi:predicted ATP-dependent serine protease
MPYSEEDNAYYCKECGNEISREEDGKRDGYCESCYNDLAEEGALEIEPEDDGQEAVI